MIWTGMEGDGPSPPRTEQDAALLRIACKAARLGGWTIEMPDRKLTWSDETCAIHDAPPGYQPTLEEGMALFPPEYRAEVASKVEACIRKGTPYEFEVPKNTIKGRRIWVRSIGEPVRDAQGNIVCLQGAFQDITDRKRFETQLYQAQKMETVGRLAGGIAHEFNSLLTAILGHSELLLGKGFPDSLQVRGAAEINKAARKAATLTRQLLAYGRRQMLRPAILNLNLVLSNMEGTIQHLLGSRSDLLFVTSRNLKPVKADAGQIEQVIINIVMNAADAMPHGGKLTIETSHATVDQAAARDLPELIPGDYVTVAFTDSGAGIGEEIAGRIFEPFFTTKDVGQGTGLGLSTCYGIVRQSGGHITVASEPGRGATFTVYLPQAATKPDRGDASG